MSTIGIDLGTTYSCVASYQHDEVQIIPNDVGRNTTPSYVAFVDGDIVIGETAKSLAHENPQDTIFDFKRMIGRRLSDPSIQSYSKIWPFKLVDEGEELKVLADNKTHTPGDVSSKILEYLKQRAEDYIGEDEIKRAVVAIPAYFNEEQKKLTASACAQAGLEVLQFITEPVAAAIAYNIQRGGGGGGGKTARKNCLIFDLGGGTFDVAIVSSKDRHVQIKKVGGDPRLGGEDFDNRLVQYCLDEFKRKHSVDLTTGSAALSSRNLRRLKMECEKQKCFLSQVKKVVIGVDAIHNGIDLVVHVTRETFDELHELYFQKCLMILKFNLLESGLGRDDIDDIVLVGGSSRIPRVQQLLTDFFGKKLTKSVNPDEAVAIGAAMQGHYLEHPEEMQIIIEEKQLLPSPLSSSPFDFDLLRRILEESVQGASRGIEPEQKSTVSAHKVTSKYKLKDVQNKLPIVAEAKNSSSSNNRLIAEIEIAEIHKKPGASWKNIMLQVDRGNYTRQNPYAPRPSAIGCNVNISAPNIHAFCLDTICTHLQGSGGTALDIGSGSGFMTACLAILLGEAGRVIGIDHMETLVDQSIKNIQTDNPSLLTSGRVTFVVGDAMEGLKSQGPYDVIHIGAAIPGVSKVLTDQLKPGGIMVSPVDKPNGGQSLQKIVKLATGKIEVTEILGVIFTKLTTAEAQLKARV